MYTEVNILNAVTTPIAMNGHVCILFAGSFITKSKSRNFLTLKMTSPQSCIQTPTQSMKLVGGMQTVIEAHIEYLITIGSVPF